MQNAATNYFRRWRRERNWDPTFSDSKARHKPYRRAPICQYPETSDSGGFRRIQLGPKDLSSAPWHGPANGVAPADGSAIPPPAMSPMRAIVLIWASAKEDVGMRRREFIAPSWRMTTWPPAKALGPTVPSTLLVAADEVIE
jgi:hypothetical protein